MSFIIAQAVQKAGKLPPAPKKKLYKHTKYLQRAAKKVREDFQDLDSTAYAESMDPKRKNYQIRPEYIAPLKASV